MPGDLAIRAATPDDAAAIWRIVEPIIRAGETYALPRDMSEADAVAFFLRPDETFVAVDGDDVLGVYFLRANQRGGGAHVCNCGYATAPAAQGRGVASAMCAHSLELGRERGFRAMQFNFVISTNERAVRLWQRHGFAIVGTLPEAFAHPRLGFVDAFVMSRRLGG